MAREINVSTFSKDSELRFFHSYISVPKNRSKASGLRFAEESGIPGNKINLPLTTLTLNAFLNIAGKEKNEGG